jgi:hypothetical protein
MYDLLVIAIVLFCGALGSQKGFRATTVAFLELLCCFVPAVLLHEWLADWLIAGTKVAFEPFLPQRFDLQPLAILIAFALPFWGALTAVQVLAHKGGDDEEDMVRMNPLIDGVSGAVVGGCAGAVFAGTVLVTISMLPIATWLKPAADRMFFDVGRLALRTAAHLVPEHHGGRSLVLDGEPPSRKSVPLARLTTEPWVDVDLDGRATDADRYRDVDGGGTYTPDLYFEDVDNDTMRRIGLADKYAAGRWDALLQSDVRDREDLKPPVAPAPPPPPPPPAASAGPTVAVNDEPAAATPRVAEWTKGGRLLPKRASQRPPPKRTALEMQDDF